MSVFKLKAPYSPAGDQPAAIRELSLGLREGKKYQTLLGVTGSGKTYTMANVIARYGRPTLVISPQQNSGRTALRRAEKLFP